MILIEGKPWYASRGVWGGIVSAVAGVSTIALGVEWTDTDQSQLVELAMGLAPLVGGVVAIVGRVYAKRPIAPVAPASPQNSP